MAHAHPVTSGTVLDALRKVTDPETGKDLVTLGLVANIRVQDGKVSFDIYLPSLANEQKDQVRAACVSAVKAVPGVSAVMPNIFQKPKPRVVHGAQAVPGVNHVVVVGSGKGGVGKSTSTVNLAMALKKLGHKVGIMDADIYGPSVPTMLGQHFPRGTEGAQPEMSDNLIVPFDMQGIKVISLGLLIGRDQPTVWRAPMATKMIQQFLLGVKWGELDYLLIDLPPGTGDIQLSLSQQSNLTGAIVVTTPQQVAIEIARKGLLMFKHVGVPILGIVETMSGFGCTECGATTAIFGEGGAKKLAAEDNVPLIGQIPVDAALVRASDEGEPIVLRDPKSPSAQAYMQAATRMIATIEAMTGDNASQKDIVPLAVEPLPPAMQGSPAKLAIFWSDGQKYTYEAKQLRFRCPCAVCVDEFSGERKITENQIAKDVALEKALPVGRYGVNLVWSDKHSTGIYTYRYLRELDAVKTMERPTPPPQLQA